MSDEAAKVEGGASYRVIGLDLAGNASSPTQFEYSVDDTDGGPPGRAGLVATLLALLPGRRRRASAA